ncbi:hypothetical protein C9374_002465 [Naegleria lovaniensis]|uniref:Uncharacterized protein n=1 Tax=Naegleria lovaniensis TaxID=51637 RepID=A0AA88GVP7_NAELO|nr:uncharacterized protein C9374_002465 [Naegleria lovaniensis]KAG2386721.1 hypothetical protein C9374_002465 [Naegleria lovaniensis]
MQPPACSSIQKQHHQHQHSSHLFQSSSSTTITTTGRDRAISSPAPLQKLKTTRIIHHNHANPSPNHHQPEDMLMTQLPSQHDHDVLMQEDDDYSMTTNHHHDPQGSSYTGEEMNEDLDDSTNSTSQRRFSLPSSDLMNMPFYRQQKIDHFQQWYGLYGDFIMDDENGTLMSVPGFFAQQSMELKDITGMKVLSSHECQQQCEMLMRELKDFQVDLNLHVLNHV